MAAKTERAEMTADEKFEALIAALMARDAGTGLTKADLAEILQANSTAMQKALKPENETHPGKSVYSYPEGEQAKPKGALPFEVFFNGFPVHKFPETETAREWELYAQLTPGEFTVIRKDGSPMTVTVKGEKDAVGKLTKLVVEFPILREERGLVPPKTVLLYQLIHHENPRQAFIEAMQEYYASMTIGAA